MANIALSSNGIMDGDRAVDRNNDLVQLTAYTSQDGSRIQAGIPVGNGTTAVTFGLVPGLSTVRKFGANEAIGTTQEDIWFNGGMYPWPTTAQTIRVRAGGNPNDDDGGTGAQTIRVTGLDENWNVAVEDITLAGASASSPTTTTFIRINTAKVLTCGTYSSSNAGNIIIENTGSAAALANIEAGFGRTQLSMYTVPAGFQAWLQEFFVTVAGNKPTSLYFWKRDNADDVTTPFSPKEIVLPLHEVDAAFEHQAAAVEPFPPKTDLWWSGAAVSGTSSATVEYDMILQDLS
jgi:hypothetical protein